MEDMDHFAGALEGMIGGRMVRIAGSTILICQKDVHNAISSHRKASLVYEGRKLNLHTEMRFWEVPNECRSVVKKFLVTKKFVVSENDCESEQAAFVGSKTKFSSRTLPSRRIGFMGLFNGMSSIKKSKERTKPTRDYNRRHTIEPCEINFAPITEEN
ncbi:hypothetical protein Y032_0468g2002 [Ancylostoma ceylanicum]|nr:hypothetical protein Y032_0468g2002 [Ancylostoma ceylanicum]